jgi:hypothetical protein
MIKTLRYDRALDKPIPSNKRECAELLRLLDEYLDNGGTVTHVPDGATNIKVVLPCKRHGDSYLNSLT